MKTLKKVLCILLSVLLCSSFILPAIAEEIEETEDTEDPQKLVIFVEGIAARDILKVGSDEGVFPPSANSIVNAVFKALPGIMGAIVKQDISVMEQPLVEAVNDIFLPAACDENGIPSPDTYFDWEWPSDEDILAAYESQDPHARIVYCYDWRLSMQTIVSGLHDFIMHVMEVTGVEKVSLIGFSMGASTVMSYLKMYEDEYYNYIEGVVLLAGAFSGVSSCGEPFSGQVWLDSDALVRFVDGMINPDDSLMNVILTTLIHALNNMGTLDKVVDLGNEIVEKLKPAVYEQVFTQTFATMPGMWALIAPEDYEAAKAILAGTLPQSYIDTIDWYQYEVQANREEIIDDLLDRGINFGIVAKYGYAVTPVISDINSMSDSVIDTKYESFGATCAPVDSTLGDGYVQAVNNGHNCISADGMIDSSTCAYCDYTWFVKNIAHSNEYGAMMNVCRPIIDADQQITVWDEAPAAAEGEEQEVRYSQFSIYDEKLGKVVPLTAENNVIKYTVDPSQETAWTIFVNNIKNLISFFKKTIENFKNQLHSFGDKIVGFGNKIANLGNAVC